MADSLAGEHVILEASYFMEAPDINRAYVVGADLAGAEVSGSAITQADVDLDGKRAQITIAPHCGVELWDVLNVTDTVANQAANYRVSGYVMEFRAGVYRHILDLCAP